MSDKDLSSSILALIQEKMKGDNISIEAFTRVVEEELARVSTRAAHESQGTPFQRFLNKHSGALVSFALGTVLATCFTLAIDSISKGKQEQRKFYDNFEQRVYTYERLLAERIERGNLLRFAIRYEMPVMDLNYRKVKYDESYLQPILSFSQFRRFTTQALKMNAEHLIIKTDTLDESDIFSSIIEGYLTPLNAAVDSCISNAYRVQTSPKGTKDKVFIGDLLDNCPYGVSRPADWIDWSEAERANYQKGRPVEYYSASDLNMSSRECVSKIFDSVKGMVLDERKWDADSKLALVDFCTMDAMKGRILSCSSDDAKMTKECKDSESGGEYGVRVVKNDTRRDSFLKDGSLLGRLLEPQE